MSGKLSQSSFSRSIRYWDLYASRGRVATRQPRGFTSSCIFDGTARFFCRDRHIKTELTALLRFSCPSYQETTIARCIYIREPRIPANKTKIMRFCPQSFPTAPVSAKARKAPNQKVLRTCYLEQNESTFRHVINNPFEATSN